MKDDPTNDFADDVPTRVTCPGGCHGDFKKLDETEQPPATYEEAWRKPVVCRGTSKWYWCRGPHQRVGLGFLTLVDKTEVMFFPDRRVADKPVTVERRKLPKP